MPAAIMGFRRCVLCLIGRPASRRLHLSSTAACNGLSFGPPRQKSAIRARTCSLASCMLQSALAARRGMPPVPCNNAVWAHGCKCVIYLQPWRRTHTKANMMLFCADWARYACMKVYCTHAAFRVLHSLRCTHWRCLCRGKSNQYNHTSLLKIDGVNTKEETDFYMGKRVAFIYRAPTRKQGTTFRCVWGKVLSAQCPWLRRRNMLWSWNHRLQRVSAKLEHKA